MRILEKLRILIVGQFTGLGGAEQSLMPLVQDWAAQGMELTLLLMRSPENSAVFQAFPGTVVIAAGGLSRIRQLSQMIATHDLAIATSELTPTYLTWLLTRWHRKPMIADVQVVLSQWIRDGRRPIHHDLCRWVYAQIPVIRCVSEGVADDLVQHYQIRREQLTVIYVPFDVDRLRDRAAQAVPPQHQHWFQAAAQPVPRPVIVASGRLTSQKRFDRAIAAVQQLQSRHGIAAQLLILGDGPLRSALAQAILQANLSDSVHLLGFVENPHAYVQQADVFLLSSDYEGLPRVVIEALAVGAPVVATDCPSGPAEILGDPVEEPFDEPVSKPVKSRPKNWPEQRQWGVLVSSEDPVDLADAIAQLLHNPARMAHLRRVGPQRAQAFGMGAIAQQYRALIQQALLI
jgi:glycosyltransferase involved in cell wall biosynthesis